MSFTFEKCMFDVGFLYSNPLSDKKVSSIALLDSESELELIKEGINDAIEACYEVDGIHKSVSMISKVATTDALQTLNVSNVFIYIFVYIYIYINTLYFYIHNINYYVYILMQLLIVSWMSYYTFFRTYFRSTRINI